MQDPTVTPACLPSQTSNLYKTPPSEDYKHHHHHHSTNAASSAVTKSGQSLFMSVYRTKIADQCRLITITWCKNLLLHGLSVSVQAISSTSNGTNSSNHQQQSHYTCKVELKPWYFWRKTGSKRFNVDGSKPVDVYWHLKSAKFNGETEPTSDYYVAVVYDSEAVLLLGDLKKEALKKTGCRLSLIEPILVSKKEHIFGKKKFTAKAKFHERGRFHEISIEYKMNKCGGSGNGNKISTDGQSSSIINRCFGGVEPAMEIRIDGILAIQVKHLQWKFRGNQSIHLNRLRIDVFWDVHDWIFNPGLRHGLFIFKPVINMPCRPISSPSPSSSSLSTLMSPSTFSSPAPSSFSSPLSSSKSTATPGSSVVDRHGMVNSGSSLTESSSSDYCLFLYAWKVE